VATTGTTVGNVSFPKLQADNNKTNKMAKRFIITFIHYK
jgi:hypothetical protein